MFNFFLLFHDWKQPPPLPPSVHQGIQRKFDFICWCSARSSWPSFGAVRSQSLRTFLHHVPIKLCFFHAVVCCCISKTHARTVSRVLLPPHSSPSQFLNRFEPLLTKGVAWSCFLQLKDCFSDCLHRCCTKHKLPHSFLSMCDEFLLLVEVFHARIATFFAAQNSGDVRMRTTHKKLPLKLSIFGLREPIWACLMIEVVG